MQALHARATRLPAECIAHRSEEEHRFPVKARRRSNIAMAATN
jgi:hypothetical protein